jgi:thiosulfate reductase/polysulfide reductase chain A
MGTRRDFIKITGLGALGLTVGSQVLPGKSASLMSTLLEDPTRRIPTYCEVCFWKCAGWVHKDPSNTLVKVVGNEADPHCNGRLCPRGTGGLGMYYDEDRLTTPLIRVVENGKQTFRKASWEEAFDLIAEKMKMVADTYGPESFALFKHGSSGDHFTRLFKAYGSQTIAAPSYAQCRGPRDAGWQATFGTGVGSPEPTDIRDTRCLVLIGSHLGENMHNGQVQEMADAIDKGATIITVDPRYSTAASKSTHWLPIKPATDIALLMAWINVILEEELFDKEYVEQYTIGLDQLRQHVRRMTPEWAYGITTIKPHVIRKTARAMANAAPATIIHPGRHVTWYGDDTQRSRAIAILNALLGSWGRRGGFYFMEKVSVPDFPHPEFPKPAWTWRDLQADRYPLAGSAATNVFLEASMPDSELPHPVKAWWVTGTNLPLTMPQRNVFEAAAQAIDFMVVVDTMPMEITGYADVVLPECTFLERYDDLRNSPHREPFVGLRMPAAEPVGDSKPAWWMAKEVANRLGLQDYFNFTDYREVLDWQLKKIGSSLAEMEKLGVKKYDRKTPLYLGKGQAIAFRTPSGKIELYSSRMKDLGFDPLPNYTAHPQPSEGYYRLNYGRAPMHTFSRTANNPNLTDLMDENTVWVNPKVAKIWGLQSGQEVWLKNQDGVISSFPIKVRVTERIRFDSVYMVHGFGHSNEQLSRAHGKGACDAELISRVQMDPLMGGTGLRGNFVTFLLNQPKES